MPGHIRNGNMDNVRIWGKVWVKKSDSYGGGMQDERLVKPCYDTLSGNRFEHGVSDEQIGSSDLNREVLRFERG